MGGYRDPKPYAWSSVGVSRSRPLWRWSWIVLLGVFVASVVGAFRGRRTSAELVVLAIGSGCATLLAALLRDSFPTGMAGSFEMDRESLRVDGRPLANRDDIRWVFRPAGSGRAWCVHRSWFLPPLRLVFDERGDDARFGEELADRLGTPPQWGASPIRARMWVAMTATCLAFAVPFAATVATRGKVEHALLIVGVLLAIVFCPTRLAFTGGELRETWLWGTRSVRLSDIAGYRLVRMDYAKPPSWALELRLRDGTTRRMGVGMDGQRHPVVDALSRESSDARDRAREDARQ